MTKTVVKNTTRNFSRPLLAAGKPVVEKTLHLDYDGVKIESFQVTGAIASHAPEQVD